MNEHLDVWQNVPNVGKLLLWIDWINGKMTAGLTNWEEDFLP